MSDPPMHNSTGRWHRPGLYGTIVAIYFLALSIGAAIVLSQYVWYESHPTPNVITYGPGPEFYILTPAGLLAVSGLAAYMLMANMRGSFVKPFQYAVLFLWSVVAVAMLFGAVISSAEAADKGLGIEAIYLPYLEAYAFVGANGIMYFFLHEAQSLRHSYRIRLKSPVALVSIASVGGFVVLSVWYILLSANPSLSYSSSGQLPDFVFSQAVRDSPEGKAFLARYPNSDVYVSQDMHDPNCCSVTLGYLRDKTDTCISTEKEYWCHPQGPGASLSAHVVWSSDTKRVSVSGFSMSCDPVASAGPAAGWMVKGNIVQNLAPGTRDCWDTGPPPTPSNAELIKIANSTEVAKAYFARYPNNVVSVETNASYTPINQPWVTFTPIISEPIQYGVSFTGQNWDVAQVWVICTDGHYHNRSDNDFWSIFNSNSNCFTSVHDNLIIANRTAQVQSLMEKYPRIRLQGFDSIGAPTISGSNSTVEYHYRGYWEDKNLREVHLLVSFEPGSHKILDFNATCTQFYGPEGIPVVHSKSGQSINMTEFLQDTYCPASTGDIYPRYH